MKNKRNLRIEFTDRFNKQREAAPLDIKVAFREALGLFLEDSLSPYLRNHPLKEKLSGYRSIDVTEDWRAIFREEQTDNHTIIRFVALGTHQQLYS
jgi:addiction module RelE/StbE family toxin